MELLKLTAKWEK